MPDTPKISLKAVDFRPTAFTATQYTPTIADPTLLARSLQMQEAREQNSRQQLDTIDAALGQTRAQLNSAEHEWFDSKANDIRQAIDTQIELGNYQSAIRIAQEQARDFKRDTEIQNKLLLNASYNKEQQRVQSMGLDPLTLRRWKAENPYTYKGSSEYVANWNPVKDISLSSLQTLAAQITAEDANSISSQVAKSGQVLHDSKGNVVNDITHASRVFANSSTNRSSSTSTHVKTKEDIEKTFRSLLADPNIKASLVQKYSTAIWGYNDALTRVNDINLTDTQRAEAQQELQVIQSEFTDKNGVLYSDYDAWINDKVVSMFKNMEYYRTAKSTGSSDSINYNDGIFAQKQQAKVNKALAITETQVGVTGTPIQSTYPIQTGEIPKVDYSSFFNK